MPTAKLISWPHGAASGVRSLHQGCLHPLPDFYLLRICYSIPIAAAEGMPTQQVHIHSNKLPRCVKCQIDTTRQDWNGLVAPRAGPARPGFISYESQHPKHTAMSVTNPHNLVAIARGVFRIKSTERRSSRPTTHNKQLQAVATHAAQQFPDQTTVIGDS